MRQHGEKPVEFQGQKSNRAVTHQVKIVKTGNMILIDTPGTNDPDKKRSDTVIHQDIMNTRCRSITEKYFFTTLTPIYYSLAPNFFLRGAPRAFHSCLRVGHTIYVGGGMQSHIGKWGTGADFWSTQGNLNGWRR